MALGTEGKGTGSNKQRKGGRKWDMSKASMPGHAFSGSALALQWVLPGCGNKSPAVFSVLEGSSPWGRGRSLDTPGLTSMLPQENHLQGRK